MFLLVSVILSTMSGRYASYWNAFLFLCCVYLQVKLKSIQDQYKSDEKLTIHDSINIKPWSLTLGATPYLKVVIVRSMSYAWNVVLDVCNKLDSNWN